MKELTSVQQFAGAMAYLGAIVRMRGRRLDRMYRESRMKRMTWDPNSGALTAHMAPRALRRSRAKELGIDFRPVYGYRGIPLTLGLPVAEGGEYAGG